MAKSIAKAPQTGQETMAKCVLASRGSSVALADPTYSHASFVIKKVKSTISIELSTDPFGGGGAYIRFDAEPK